MLERITYLWMWVSWCICCCCYVFKFCFHVLFFVCLFGLCLCLLLWFVFCFALFCFFSGYFTEYLRNWSSTVKWSFYDTSELVKNLNYKGLGNWDGSHLARHFSLEQRWYFSLSLLLSGFLVGQHCNFNF